MALITSYPPALVQAEGPAVVADVIQSRIASHIAPYIDSEQIVGMSIGIIDHEKRWTQHFGSTDVVTSCVPNDDTIYEIGSISKVFTGILFGRALALNKLSLDDSLDKVIPEGYPVEYRNEEPIRLVHLATHTSGLERLPPNLLMEDPTRPYENYREEELYQALGIKKPVRRPGKRIRYSNYGVGILGNIVARTEDKTYPQLLIDELCEPLSMTSTRVVITDKELLHFAQGHNVDTTPVPPWEIVTLAGAGGIHSSTKDMMLFMQSILDPPQTSLGKGIEMSLQCHQEAIDTEDFAMGLCWHIARDKTTRWHNGQTGGFHSMLMIDSKNRRAIIALANTAAPVVDLITQSIYSEVAGIHISPSVIEPSEKINPDELDKIAGEYRMQLNGDKYVFENRNGKLFATLANQFPARLFPSTNDGWKYRIVDARVEFGDLLPDTNGTQRYNTVVLFQNGLELHAKRISD